jgi:hypothetical protein
LNEKDEEGTDTLDDIIKKTRTKGVRDKTPSPFFNLFPPHCFGNPEFIFMLNITDL